MADSNGGGDIKAVEPQSIDKRAAPQTARRAEQGGPLMHVKVHSPYKIYFDEEARGISAVNTTGPFDILPHHHNFMTLLTPAELVIHGTQGKESRIKISGGLMHVKADHVTVFLDI